MIEHRTYHFARDFSAKPDFAAQLFAEAARDLRAHGARVLRAKHGKTVLPSEPTPDLASVEAPEREPDAPC